MADAADLRSFEIWRTLGAGGVTGVAWGATLLEVDQTSDGSRVRFVYSGLGDFVCRRTTVMAWEKQIAGKTPADLARPANLCQSERKPDRFRAKVERRRSKQIVQGIENDTEAFHVQCGDGWHRFLPTELADQFESRVMAAIWGDHLPDFSVIDPAAERNGQEFAAIAGPWKYAPDDTIQTFHRWLLDYHGPIGKPAHDWRVETRDGLRLRQFVEPRVEFGWGQSKSSSLPLRLTLDRRSGKVLKSEPSVDFKTDSLYVNAVSEASLSWVFDPSSVPQNAVVTVTVHFQANCGGQN